MRRILLSDTTNRGYNVNSAVLQTYKCSTKDDTRDYNERKDDLISSIRKNRQ